MWNMDISQIIYNYVFVIGGVGLVVWGIFKLGVKKVVEDHLAELSELKPNGGSSMKDTVNRLEKRVDEIYKILAQQNRRVKATKRK